MEDEIEDFGAPNNTNTFCIPNDPELQRVACVYKTSVETKKLYSERGRETYAEAFIEDPRLGTLSDLCVRALAKVSTKYIHPAVQQDNLKLRIQYDALDVDTPLKDCYFVDDLGFWRRVVLAKTKDATLMMKKLNEFDWKGRGVSMKYIELVEACPAEYWPGEAMHKLALLVKDFVKEIQIKKLQSLQDQSFEQYFESDSDSAVSEPFESIEISSDEPTTTEEEEEEVEEEEEPSMPQPQRNRSVTKLAKKKSITVEQPVVLEEECEPLPKTDEEILLEQKHIERRRARNARNAIRQELRREKEEKRAEYEERLRRRMLKMKMSESEPVAPPKKKKKKKAIRGVFDIEVEPEPDDPDDEVPDNRNKEKRMQRIKRYKYPPEHCHHIDLSFVKDFVNLISFEIEFLGPDMGRNFHNRHFNFSYDDITRLARGLKSLSNLKVFRLRNSRMDTKKLQILTRALKYIDTLETIDLGYDDLDDNCGSALTGLFGFLQQLQVLELENNHLGPNVMEALGYAIKTQTCDSLRYLGLAHNPLGDNGLRELCTNIVGTDKISELNLTGIECTDEGIMLFVSDMLLRQHRPLRSLNISAIPLSHLAGREVIKALEQNRSILKFDCRGCDLEEVPEFEANLIVRRNNYLAKNSYIGRGSLTEEKVNEIVASRRHPIMVKVLAEIEEHEECVRNRPLRTPSETDEYEEEETLDERYFRLYGRTVPTFATSITTEVDDYSSTTSEKHEPFVYDPNSFTEEQFREHVYCPGPPNRYYYFQEHKGL